MAEHAGLRIMSFNIRTSLADDGSNNWRFRKDLVTGAIRSGFPDLLGVQEPTREQWEHLASALGDEWTGVAHSRRDAVGKESHLQGLFFRNRRFTVLADGCFWLSPTPSEPGSVSEPNHWGARTCDWARLRDGEAGRELTFAVTHLDTHPDAWLPGVRVLAEELGKAAAGAPVILVGDFNCAAGCPAWQALTGSGGFTDAWTAAGLADEGVTTFNAFMPIPRLPLDDLPRLEQWMHDTCDAVPQFAHYPAHVLQHRNYRIDWIMFRGPFAARAAHVDTRDAAGRTPSDHWPILASLEWKG